MIAQTQQLIQSLYNSGLDPMETARRLAYELDLPNSTAEAMTTETLGVAHIRPGPGDHRERRSTPGLA